MGSSTVAFNLHLLQYIIKVQTLGARAVAGAVAGAWLVVACLGHNYNYYGHGCNY